MAKNKKGFKPKVMADERIEYEGVEEPQDFTYFEELQKKVEVLQEMVDLHAEILSQNNLSKNEKTEALSFDEDEVYKRLEGY